MTFADLAPTDSPGQGVGTHLLTLYSIARFLPAKTACEIGVGYGASTTALLLGVRDAGGHLHSVDVEPCDAVREEVRRRGLDPWWTFHHTRSADYDCPPLDLLFIDGDHATAAADWAAHGPRVRVGGVILLHDYYGGCASVCGACPQCLGVRTLVDGTIRPDRRYEAATLPYGYGLTVVRKLA